MTMTSIVNQFPRKARTILGKARNSVGKLLDDIFWTKPPLEESWSIDTNKGIANMLGVPLLAWINYHQQHVIGDQQRPTWLGQRALKNPMDAWIYQEIIYETKPDIIIELGNKVGGSTLFLASICQLMDHGRVLAIDIDHDQFTSFHPRIELVTGDCADESILSKIRNACAGQSVMIIHDADHRKAGVLRDLRNFSPLVSTGSYFIVEDSILGVPGFGGRDRPVGNFLWPNQNTPLQAIEQFLKENNNFVVDESRECYILTSNYRGFLKRVG